MDFKQIQSIIRDFERSNIAHLDIETEGFKLKLRKNCELPHLADPNILNAKEAIEEKNEGFKVTAPLVGTYYEASGPNEKPFVTEGQRVKKGQTLCIIEAMKIMNEITAPVDGVIEKIYVQNGSSVGFDQTLMVIS